ncbi:hypothetical protein OQA88_2650 [Cercophora sp. LCS_1]
MRYHAPLGVEECRGAGASAGVEGEKHHRHDHDHDHDHNDKHRHDHDHDHEHSLNEDPLYIASRCHENFIENVPFALILAAVAELNGAIDATSDERRNYVRLLKSSVVSRQL